MKLLVVLPVKSCPILDYGCSKTRAGGSASKKKGLAQLDVELLTRANRYEPKGRRTRRSYCPACSVYRARCEGLKGATLGDV